MKKLRHALLSACIPLVLLGACEADRGPRFVQRKEQIEHFSDGRYGYEENGIWFYLYMAQAMNSGSRTIVTTSPTYFVSSSPIASSGFVGGAGCSGCFNAPSGAAWSKGPPPTKEEVEKAEKEDVELTEDEKGEAVTPDQEKAEIETQPETIEATAPASAEASAGGEREAESAQSEPASAPAASSEASSSSDSGGGGDSGGGSSD